MQVCLSSCVCKLNSGWPRAVPCPVKSSGGPWYQPQHKMTTDHLWHCRPCTAAQAKIPRDACSKRGTSISAVPIVSAGSTLGYICRFAFTIIRLVRSWHCVGCCCRCTLRIILVFVTSVYITRGDCLGIQRLIRVADVVDRRHCDLCPRASC